MKRKQIEPTLSLNPIENIYLKNEILSFWFKSFSEFNRAVALNCNYSTDINTQISSANEILNRI